MAALAAGLVAVGLLGGACSGGDDEPAPTTTTTEAPATTTTTEPPLEAGTQLDPDLFTFSVGDCFDRRKVPGSDNKQVEVILTLDCQLPHQFEVYATLDYPVPEDDETTWPGDEALRTFARAECTAPFEDYVGAPYETSDFEIGFLLPPEASFSYDQTVGCYVYDPAHERSSGTARGAAR